jgi:hypothetical protein
MLYPLLTEIRKREGLSSEPPNPEEFMEEVPPPPFSSPRAQKE